MPGLPRLGMIPHRLNDAAETSGGQHDEGSRSSMKAKLKMLYRAPSTHEQVAADARLGAILQGAGTSVRIPRSTCPLGPDQCFEGQSRACQTLGARRAGGPRAVEKNYRSSTLIKAPRGLSSESDRCGLFFMAPAPGYGFCTWAPLWRLRTKVHGRQVGTTSCMDLHCQNWSLALLSNISWIRLAVSWLPKPESTQACGGRRPINHPPDRGHRRSRRWMSVPAGPGKGRSTRVRRRAWRVISPGWGGRTRRAPPHRRDKMARPQYSEPASFHHSPQDSHHALRRDMSS